MNTQSPDTSYLQVVHGKLMQDFKDHEDLQSAGGAILEFLAKTPPQNASRLSFAAIRNIIKRNRKLTLSDHDLMSITGYFVGGRVRLLDMIYHYRDPETNETYRIPKDKMRQALETGSFYHPMVPDETVDDFETYIIISYMPSKLAEQEFNKHHSSQGK